MNPKKILTVLLSIFSVYLYGQEQKPEIIDILPKWEINDTHTLVTKKTVSEIVDRKTVNSTSTFNATIKVVEKNENGYILQWIFTNSKLSPTVDDSEDKVISKLQGKEIRIKFSKYGEFIRIDNENELRLTCNKILDDFIAKEKIQKEKAL
ncbi:hypothetical protein NAT51_14005 [Flavobacterium amniphilum]|uniref:hypothetical protein n=1 Tax=Flavobacterium amniphilum TaxID=1834035 RepID=UPI00202A06A7|nr:hypothetical protein [Flavobacterium amniphilum]MCL9806645.1 hypothetical protein [Flavobacterium amniphilum]